MRCKMRVVPALLLWLASLPVLGQGPATLESLLQDGQPVAVPPLVNADEGKRLPVPHHEAVAAARDLIRQAYEEDYSDTAEAAIRRLVAKLVEAVAGVDDPPRKYALLLEAQGLAIAAADMDTAIDVASQRSTVFEVDAAECRLDVLLAASKDEHRDDNALCELLLALVDQSLQRGQVEVAERALGEAMSAAKRLDKREKQAGAEERRRTGRKATEKGRAAGLLERAVAQQRELKNREKSQGEYEEALEVLRDRPDDAAANTRVGRHRCFVLGEWQDGLRALKAGDAEKLQAVAEQEIALGEAEPPPPAQILAVAASWWKVAEAGGLPVAETQAIKRHAAELYEQALPDVEDPIERTLASKRIAAVNPGADAMPKAAKPGRGEKAAALPRRGAVLKIPCSAILPAPADLSPQLVNSLPTATEVATILNHVNVPDREVSTARDAFFRRVYSNFAMDQWTPVDALYLIEMNDKINELLGRAFVTTPDWSMSGSRESCKAAFAAAWLLKSKSEQEFVRRAGSLPADVKGRSFDRCIGESEAKKWLTSLGPEYANSRRKLQAVEYLVKHGAATDLPP
jgi:hypothetical protein